jgi:predicted phosphatase
MSKSKKIALFDLDLTLTCRHLWKDLRYHRLGVANLQSKDVSIWVADQGGPTLFKPESLKKIFQDLREDGFDLGIATYNYEYVARQFLQTFNLLDYFRSDWIVARDTQGSGSKSDDWALILQRSGLGREHHSCEALYYDDSLGECMDVKQSFPWIKIHHVQRPLSSPAPDVRIV